MWKELISHRALTDWPILEMKNSAMPISSEEQESLDLDNENIFNKYFHYFTNKEEFQNFK